MTKYYSVEVINILLNYPSIHFLTPLSLMGSEGLLVFISSCVPGERRGSPWTGRQSVAGQHRDIQDKQPFTHTLTPRENLEKPINLTVMFLDCGRKLENPERTHACTGRTCKLHAERPRAGNRTQDLLAARQQLYQLHHCAAYYLT